MAYNFNKHTCDNCGIKEEEYDKKHPFTYGPGRDELASFRLNYNTGGVLCGECHKEKSLQRLFKLMDKRDKIRLDKYTKDDYT